MVTREQPPHSITPIKTSSFHIQDAHSELLPSASSDSSTPSRPWATERLDEFGRPAIRDPPSQTSESFLPQSLQPGINREAVSGRSSMEQPGSDNIPESLRPGPPSYTPRASQDEERPALRPTNPFRRQHTGESVSQGVESSTHAWGEPSGTPPQPTVPPPPPPSDDHVSDLLGNLSFEESNSNPWEPIAPVTARNSHPVQGQNIFEEYDTKVWDAPPPGRNPPPPPVPVETEDRRSSVYSEDSEDSEDWNDERTEPKNPPEVPQVHVVSPVNEEQSAWEETYVTPQLPHIEKQEELAKQVDNITNETNGWQDPGPSNGLIDLIDFDTNDKSAEQNEFVPPLLPRLETEKLPAFESPLPAQNTERLKESYEIKKVRWQDVTTQSNPRISPILVQNANGPCPLVALVNALTLSTPADLETALVERLRSREQISLEFLLDAVIDELVSGRRDIAGDLPDPSELYQFLITLHTGMNVNPRFIPSAPSNLLNDSRNSMSHVHPSSRESTLPGTFEETREMKLYGTFSIPLIHGWLPLPGSPAYTALSRSAKSYEDAQNIMFREEELEEKLSQGQLSFEEQATLEDISTIRAFLSSNPTQLTTNGLEIITKSIAPASVAILFRNDHFSTLYRHPKTLQIFQLVTDMGYAGHEEVVWQSLVDVNGENCEFFSGDFRIVGENAEYHSAEEEWTTVQGRSKNKGRSNDQNPGQQYNPPSGPPPGHGSGMPSPTEQEDHDLALALQLQEEEEQKERDDVARRKRETEYSERFIEQQAGSSGAIPVSTRGGLGRGNNPPKSSNRRTSSASNNGSQLSGVISSPGGRGRGNNASTVSLSPSSARPIVPPRRGGPSSSRVSSVSVSTPRPPPTARLVDPEAGEEAPPPSYEEASSAAAYNPPVDHPAHPSANPLVAQAAAQNQGSSPSVVGHRRTGNFSQANGNVVYGGRGGGNSGQVQGQGQQQGGKQGRESCVLM